MKNGLLELASAGAMLLMLSSVDVTAQPAVLDGTPSLAYWSIGLSSARQTIVVVHGGPGLSHDYLLPEWRRLASERRVIFYDQRGCGGSGEASDYSWECHVGDLKRLLEHVSPDEPVVLAGSSWGATLAWYYADSRPADVAALVLSGLPAPRVWSLPGGGTGSGPPQDIDWVRTREERDRAAEALQERLAEECDDVRSATVASLENTPAAWRLYELTTPILFFPDNRFGRTFTDAVQDPEVHGPSAVVVGGGHDPWYFWPEEFFGLVEKFLEGVSP